MNAFRVNVSYKFRCEIAHLNATHLLTNPPSLPPCPRYDARSDSRCGEAFSPLAQSHSQLDKVPRRPLLVSHYNQPERTAVACFGS
jgi:hypothetical protein